MYSVDGVLLSLPEHVVDCGKKYFENLLIPTDASCGEEARWEPGGVLAYLQHGSCQNGQKAPQWLDLEVG